MTQEHMIGFLKIPQVKEDYTSDCFLDYWYFKENYKLIVNNNRSK